MKNVYWLGVFYFVAILATLGQEGGAGQSIPAPLTPAATLQTNTPPAAVSQPDAPQTNAAPATAPAPDAPVVALVRDRFNERAAVFNKAGEDFSDGNYDALEKTHQELLASDARFTDGTAKVSCFYGAFQGPGKVDDEYYWKEYFDKVDAWQKAKPDSMLPSIAYAAGMTSYAWQARGNGYADTVTQAGWKLFKDRLAQARKGLDDAYAAHKGKDIPPGWYSAMGTVALGQRWSHDDYNRMFDEAVATYPDYEDFFFFKAYYLQPKWYGQPGEWQQYAADSGKKYGPEIYARICWATSVNFDSDSYFDQTQIPWPMMKEGFEAMEKKWPASAWNLSAFCRFACLAKDKATAKRLFDKLGNLAFANQWGSAQNFNAAKAWANSPDQ